MRSNQMAESPVGIGRKAFASHGPSGPAFSACPLPDPPPAIPTASISPSHPRPAPLQVQAPVVEQVYGNQPKTPQSQAEETFVSTLGILGTVILLMGVYLAASGTQLARQTPCKSGAPLEQGLQHKRGVCCLGRGDRVQEVIVSVRVSRGCRLPPGVFGPVRTERRLPHFLSDRCGQAVLG